MARLLALLPYALLAAAAAFLGARWDEIPERFPIHWSWGGRPDGWATRSAAWVFGPLAFAALLCALLASLGRTALAERPDDDTRHRAERRLARGVLAGAQWVVAATSAAAALLPFLPGPGPVLAVGLGGAGLLVAGAVLGGVRLSREHPLPPSDARRWRWGLFYVDREDPRVLVPKRLGLGLTFNFGRPAAWLALLLLLGLPLALAFLVARAM